MPIFKKKFILCLIFILIQGLATFFYLNQNKSSFYFEKSIKKKNFFSDGSQDVYLNFLSIYLIKSFNKMSFEEIMLFDLKNHKKEAKFYIENKKFHNNGFLYFSIITDNPDKDFDLVILKSLKLNLQDILDISKNCYETIKKKIDIKKNYTFKEYKLVTIENFDYCMATEDIFMDKNIKENYFEIITPSLRKIENITSYHIDLTKLSEFIQIIENIIIRFDNNQINIDTDIIKEFKYKWYNYFFNGLFAFFIICLIVNIISKKNIIK